MFEAWVFILTLESTAVALKHPEPFETIDECKTQATANYIKAYSIRPVRYIMPACIPVIELPEVEHSKADTVG